MAEWQAKEILAHTGGTLKGGSRDVWFGDYHFDSREIRREGSLFFALPGSRQDGHEHVAAVLGQAGNGAIVRRDWPGSGESPGVCIAVDDPQKALERLAAAQRERMDDCRWIGVTGSAGKTTTKEFLAQLLSSRWRTARSHKNWNNWIGMPLSLLRVPGDTEAAVFELAMSDPGIGEIDRLGRTLRPHIAVVLNALPVHLEYLGTVARVAEAKTEILEHLEGASWVVMGGDGPELREAVGRRGVTGALRFGFQPDNEVCIRSIQRVPGRTLVALDWRHRRETLVVPPLTDVQVENTVAAWMVARLTGLGERRLKRALLELQPLPGRGNLVQAGGWTFVDDTYNANPQAVIRALDWLVEALPGPHVAVLGGMLELGPEAGMWHQRVGAHVARSGVGTLVAVGEEGRWLARGAREEGLAEARIVEVPDPRAAGEWLRDASHRGSALLKASRGIALERALREVSHGH